MQLRSFILLGVCAVLGMGSAAFAGPVNLVTSPSVETTDGNSSRRRQERRIAAEASQEEEKPDLGRPCPDQQARGQDRGRQGSRQAEGARRSQDGDARGGQGQGRRGAPMEWLAKKGGGAAAPAEVADAKPATKTVKVIEPLTPVAAIQTADPIPAEAMNITATGNNGELRSENPGQKQTSSGGLFAGLFGGAQATSISYLPETRALDPALARKDAKRLLQGEAGIRAAGRHVHRL
ncbi:hypothetical protein ACVOMV_37130 [Mesorhizobium atlanticum]